MINTVLSKFIDSNKSFYSKVKKDCVGGNAGAMLVDLQISDLFAVSVLMKISSAVSQVMKYEMIILPSIKANIDLLNIVRSYCPSQILDTRKNIFYGFFVDFFSIITKVLKTQTGEDLAKLETDNIPIGIHIYDSILKRMGISCIGRLTIKQKLWLMFDLSYSSYILEYFNKNEISFVVLFDTTYRQGILYEIIKSKDIPSITGIDFNGMSMHKYESAIEYYQHCRVPDMAIVDQILDSPELYSEVENYLSYRFSGQEQQHDLLMAYSADKKAVDRSVLVENYGLSGEKKIVLVMAHIFCDAPHAYPGMLFKDYEDWLLKTCLALSENSNICFLVKEHPSASLYNECGKIDEILNRIGLLDRLLSNDINTKSLFKSIDVIVTCGGTAGMEFPCYGVPVIVAASPPYASFPYVMSAFTKADYFAELAKVHECSRLSDEMIKLAKCVLYVIHSVMKLDRVKIGLGSQPYLRGGNFDMNLFMKEMIDDCIDGRGYNDLALAIENLLYGEYKNLIDFNKLKSKI